MSPLKTLLQKIEDKNFTLGVIGLGYVGLPMSLTFLRKGVKVIGFDLDPRKIEMIAKGESYIKHISSDGVSQSLSVVMTLSKRYNTNSKIQTV